MTMSIKLSTRNLTLSEEKQDTNVDIEDTEWFFCSFQLETIIL